MTPWEEPRNTVRVNGAVPVYEPIERASPGGLVSNVRSTVRGSIRRVTVVVSPARVRGGQLEHEMRRVLVVRRH